jgi:hypothetical protein
MVRTMARWIDAGAGSPEAAALLGEPPPESPAS